MVYLDDGLWAVAGRQAALEASWLVRGTLDKAGFVAQPMKTIWWPTQRLQWLGFVVDMTLGQIEVPQDKIAGLCNALSIASQTTQSGARALASIISMGLAFGPISRFMTRSLYDVLDSSCAWCELFSLSPEASDELQLWSSSLDEYNRPFPHRLRYARYSAHLLN